MRLQEYGVGIFTNALTKSALKKALKKKYITVNGVVATTATMIVGGEELVFTVPDAKQPLKQLHLALQVLWEDDHLALLHKPPGIEVSGHKFYTIANALPQNLQPSMQADACKPQPVHRLDYATTGILLVGKTSSSIRQLNALFAAQQVQKTYYAVTIGAMPSKGTISAPIDDKPALTMYEVVASVTSPRFTFLNLVKLTPKTGRRHQLRKHLHSIGNPILGDQTYYNEGLILQRKGLYLHAFEICFTHPVTQQIITVADPLPAKYLKLFQKE